MIETVKIHPVPGVTFTKPTADIDAAFKTLFEVVSAFPPFLEAQTAVQRLTEANFWIRHAFNVMEIQEKRQEELKKAQEKKIVLPGVKQ